ncbi:hypothetical protein GCK72_007165 [Caenorhabditis remanei]|uniref:DUF281 domain-containing protein n=1 Tax=Caenorhabditis remanei TaxID=31234 RepID=A0A6A5HKJ3_CAERE|nr:hypothetical protein GCK72_007165 [Caenorhabditis remanei]KAF1767206.1 hypothetical protein GCK72_007165 [Caenorhabditis remanei]
MYTNCRMETTTTEEEPTTTMATTTMGEDFFAMEEWYSRKTRSKLGPLTSHNLTDMCLCFTCQISDVFNYANSTGKVKPWYYDIATEDCSCKAHAVSCNLYTVDSCDSFAIQYIASDDQLYTLAETNGTLVEGEIQCLRNGKFGAGGRSIKELFCTHSGCKKMETATSIVE